MIPKIALFIFAFAAFSTYALPPKADGTTVEDSTIVNKASGETTASNGSSVNRGIEAKGSTIVDSTVTSSTTGNVNANSSNVDTGVKLNGAEVHGSTISANSNVSINATNSSVKAGAIDLSGANGSNVSTDVNAGINAKNSTVNVGSITGSADGVDAHTSVGAAVSAENKTVNIGNITLNSGSPGAPAGGGYKERHEKEQSQKGGSTSIGNVVVDSDKVKEVNTTVGNASGGVGDKIKTRNMANTYKDGVDPSGTKNVYISKQDAEAAERKGKRDGDASVGNTYIGSGEKDRDVKKVNTYVDQ